MSKDMQVLSTTLPPDTLCAKRVLGLRGFTNTIL